MSYSVYSICAFRGWQWVNRKREKETYTYTQEKNGTSIFIFSIYFLLTSCYLSISGFILLWWHGHLKKISLHHIMYGLKISYDVWIILFLFDQFHVIKCSPMIHFSDVYHWFIKHWTVNPQTWLLYLLTGNLIKTIIESNVWVRSFQTRWTISVCLSYNSMLNSSLFCKL